MKKIVISIGIVFFITLSFGIFPVSAFAANFSFDPTTLNINPGNTFSMKVNVDTGGINTNGASAVVVYDNTLLEVESASTGAFYPNFVPNTATAGKVILGGNADVGFPKTGTGTVGVIVFKALTNGSAALTFECSGADGPGIFQDDLNATNIMNCTSNTTSTITIGGTGGSTVATPTPISTSTSGGGSTQLPKTGFADTMWNIGLPGAVLVLIGLAVKLLL